MMVMMAMCPRGHYALLSSPDLPLSIEKTAFPSATGAQIASAPALTRAFAPQSSPVRCRFFAK
jgi:hypothetical protein